MKLPMLLLLLIAVGGALSLLTTEKSPVSGQTMKRELLEGNFGLRTTFLNKYESPNTTPGIQYAENLQQELNQQSAAEVSSNNNYYYK
ncbi:unnamed protein product [Arctia plantaginis]|uniref:Uncharacterized protein n=1 Tax=Arctia plantaginis TaxID=874455 RepID=A0A8S0Z6Q7_ARCPL|nr:unnamed protein product [Arctia plantaginis]CAB3228200.1 unnamed protein product [Arctia plantaginis]